MQLTQKSPVNKNDHLNSSLQMSGYCPLFKRYLNILCLCLQCQYIIVISLPKLLFFLSAAAEGKYLYTGVKLTD